MYFGPEDPNDNLEAQLQLLTKTHYDPENPHVNFQEKLEINSISWAELQEEFSQSYEGNLPQDFQFLKTRQFFSLGRGSSCSAYGYLSAEGEAYVLRIGGQGLDADGNRPTCPLIIPATGMFNLAEVIFETVPFVAKVMASQSELQERQIQEMNMRMAASFGLDIENALQSHSEGQDSLYLSFENRGHLQGLFYQLLDGTPWVMEDFLDVAVTKTALPVQLDPGHIKMRKGCSNPKQGTEAYQMALGQMYENQNRESFPRDFLSYVRKDAQGIFHAVVNDLFLPEGGRTSFTPYNGPRL